jgi:methylenetetrahydrofolate reductase (NADPH)
MSSAYAEDIRVALAGGKFFWTVEFVTPESAEPFEAAVKPAVALAERVRDESRVAGLSVTDRVRSDLDHDPVSVAVRLAEASGKQPLVHLAGKDRELPDLLRSLEQMQKHGLATALIVTGDRVKAEPRERRVRYLESVPAVWAAKQAWSALTVAVAVCPFKYREEECLAQYLKLGKKVRAGADYAITQIGYDMEKLRELARWCAWRGYRLPLVANLMPLTAPRGRYIRTNKVPGIVITDSLQSLVEEEAKAPDKGRGRAFRRLALQIIGVKRLGYAGVQLTAVHSWEALTELLGLIEDLERELRYPGDWALAWGDALRFKDRSVAQAAPADGFDLFEVVRPWFSDDDEDATPKPKPAAPGPPTPEYRKYRWLDTLDHWVFREGSPGARLLGPLLGRVRDGSGLERLLLSMEKLAKERVVGCETCGACRLPHTFYVCPETCPKGLANGPCGGTHGNECEFGDRECVHSAKYRIATQAGRVAELEEVLIPAVPRERRGSCSWTAHFRGEGPRVLRIQPPRREGRG